MAREDGGCFAEYLYLEKARMRRRGWVVAGKRQTRAWWRADLFFYIFLCFFPRVSVWQWRSPVGFDKLQKGMPYSARKVAYKYTADNEGMSVRYTSTI